MQTKKSTSHEHVVYVSLSIMAHGTGEHSRARLTLFDGLGKLTAA